MIFITIEIDVNVGKEAQNLHQLHDIVHVEESEGCSEFFNLIISLYSIFYTLKIFIFTHFSTAPN